MTSFNMHIRYTPTHIALQEETNGWRRQLGDNAIITILVEYLPVFDENGEQAEMNGLRNAGDGNEFVIEHRVDE